MCFLYLLLAHLIGDFVLQTDSIASKKISSFGWNLLHAAIVTVASILMAIPFGASVLYLVVLNGLFHLVIDSGKNFLGGKFPRGGLFLFLTDQLLHVIVLYGISLFAEPPRFLVFDDFTIDVLIVLCIVTSFCSILIGYIWKMVYPLNRNTFFLEKEKETGNITRALVCFSLYLALRNDWIFMIFAFVGLVLPVWIYNTRWKDWMHVKGFLIKYCLDVTAASIIGMWLYLYLPEITL